MPKAESRNESVIALDADRSTHLLLEDYTGMVCFPFGNFSDFLLAAPYHRPAIIYLDINLEKPAGGIDFIARIRDIYGPIPIMMMGKQNDANMMRAFVLGASDYLIKPLLKNEVVARTYRRILDASVLHNQEKSQHWADLEIKINQRKVLCPDAHTSVALADIPFSILKILVDADGGVLERQVLIQAAWKGHAVSSNSLDQQIHVIRSALRELNSKVELKAAYGIGFYLMSSQAMRKSG